MEKELNELLSLVRKSAETFGAGVLLSGISGIGCLAVVDDNRLVGILTCYNFLTATASLQAAPGSFGKAFR
jgi:CBS domain-containing protein